MASANTVSCIGEDPTQSNPALRAYYGNRGLMWRNIFLILLLNLGWQLAFTVINPLMTLRLNKLGMSEKSISLMGLVNSWTYAYLVMYFAWKSDHTVSRWGRRLPYLFISSPIIIVCTLVFPFMTALWILVAISLVQMFFTDIKAATIPLLQFDCMPRHLLARCAVPFGIVGGLVGWVSNKYGTVMADTSETRPYIVGALILVCTTLVGGLLIKEPPVRYPTDESFKPWSTMKVAWKDKRRIILMVVYGLIYSFLVTILNWNWLYGVNVLHLTRTQVGGVMAWACLLAIPLAYPYGWLIDHVIPYKLLPLILLAAATLLGSLLWFPTFGGFVFFCCMSLAVLQPLMATVDMMIVRNSPAEDMGSVTSTNSCLRGIYWGVLGYGSGWLINLTAQPNYLRAFTLGFVMTCLGVALVYVYGWTMRHDKSHTTATSAAEMAAAT